MILEDIKLYQEVTTEDMEVLALAAGISQGDLVTVHEDKMQGHFLIFGGYHFKAIASFWQCQGTPEGNINDTPSRFATAVVTPTAHSSRNFYKRYRSSKGGVENE